MEKNMLAVPGSDTTYRQIFFNKGVNYEKGHGVEINIGEAIKNYELAAKEGMPEAAYNLGHIYGRLKSQDSQKQVKAIRRSLHWFKKAREYGHKNVAFEIQYMEMLLQPYSHKAHPQNPERQTQTFVPYFDQTPKMIKNSTSIMRLKEIIFEIPRIHVTSVNPKEKNVVSYQTIIAP